MRFLFLTSILLVGFFIAKAQDTLSIADGSTVAVTGTSTIHDWTATVGEVTGTFVFSSAFQETPFPPTGTEVNLARIKVSVKSLDGGKGATMNNKIFAAFDEPNHPYIQFALTKGTVQGPKNDMDNKYVMVATGNLTMAGQTKPVELEVTGWIDDAGAMHVKAEKSIKMTEYGIKPPSAMFGQIQTGDEVVVKFDLVLK